QLQLTMNQPEAALTSFERAESLATSRQIRPWEASDFNARLAVGRSRAWRAMKNFDKAADFMEKALRINPMDAAAWAEFADIFDAQGKPERAIAARRQAEAVKSQQAEVPQTSIQNPSPSKGGAEKKQ
ncbi:MAG: hypothetical protein HY046_08950, partial [Acidobacteria bacterium]|nr:hypothetical protein [Acidobacteriota bacterium]